MKTNFELMCVVVTFTFVGCAGGGGGGGGDDGDASDVSGTWTITEIVDDSACGGGGAEIVTYTIDVSQSGTSLTVAATISGSTQTFSGSISGNTIHWTGSFAESGGTTTINSLSLSLNSDCSEATGNSSWTWTDGSETCSGTSQISGNRTTGSGCGSDQPTGTGGTCPDISGTWTITNHCESEMIGSPATVLQNGCSITVSEWNFTGTVSSSGAITMSGSPSGDPMTCTGTASTSTISVNCTETGESGSCAVTLSAGN